MKVKDIQFPFSKSPDDDYIVFSESSFEKAGMQTFKPIFHLATLFARREAKARIRQRDWLKLVSEEIRRE